MQQYVKGSKLITRPITIDKGRWIVQKCGRYFLLYDGMSGDHIKDFPSFDKMFYYIEEMRKAERKNENESILIDTSGTK